MQLRDFRALSFDCYGTLIDWETGIWDALSPLRRAGLSDRSAALAAFARHESAVQTAEPKASYPDVLARVHQRLSEEFDFPPDPELDVRFGGSVQDWPAFPDSGTALQYLGQHFRLIILSNVSRAAFTSSERRLGARFDAVYTAEDIKSYKPDPRNFHYLIEHCEQDFGIGKGELLHVAQSLYHDHVPGTRRRARHRLDRPPARTAGRDQACDRPPRRQLRLSRSGCACRFPPGGKRFCLGTPPQDDDTVVGTRLRMRAAELQNPVLPSDVAFKGGTYQSWIV